MKQRLMPQASYKPATLERHRTRIKGLTDVCGRHVTAVVVLFFSNRALSPLFLDYLACCHPR
jgi:hypothetical protein